MPPVEPGEVRHRLRAAAIVSVLLLVVLIVGLVAINRPPSSPQTQSSTPAAVLPSLAPPLDADLHDLLEQVTP